MAYVKTRVKLKTGEAFFVDVNLPVDIRDYHEDTISDVVSDWLTENGVDYKWYRIDNE